MSKVLVTHLHPHLDDVAASWLLARCDPTLKSAKLKFVPTSAGGIALKADEIGVGVGRGKYDEHKGDLRDSAASLVWKDLKRRGKLPSGDEGKAVTDLVDMVRRGDLGEFIGRPGNFFSVAQIVQTLSGLPGEDSRSASMIGFKMLDALLRLHLEKISIERAVKRGQSFSTKWGRGIGLVSDALPGSVSTLLAEKGYALVILQHPSRAYLHVRAAPASRADLSALAARVFAAEPDREWYFHHSKKMLLQGDLVAPTRKRTGFTVSAMIALIKRLYG